MFNNCKKKVNKNVREMGKLTQQHKSSYFEKNKYVTSFNSFIFHF